MHDDRSLALGGTTGAFDRQELSRVWQVGHVGRSVAAQEPEHDRPRGCFVVVIEGLVDRVFRDRRSRRSCRSDAAERHAGGKPKRQGQGLGERLPVPGSQARNGRVAQEDPVGDVAAGSDQHEANAERTGIRRAEILDPGRDLKLWPQCRVADDVVTAPAARSGKAPRTGRVVPGATTMPTGD